MDVDQLVGKGRWEVHGMGLKVEISVNNRVFIEVP